MSEAALLRDAYARPCEDRRARAARAKVHRRAGQEVGRRDHGGGRPRLRDGEVHDARDADRAPSLLRTRPSHSQNADLYV